MRCQNMQDNLSAYLDGELSQDAAGEIERHVEACAVCRDLLNELRSVSGLVGELPRQRAPRALSEDVQMQLERHLLLAADGDDLEPASATDRALAQERPPVWPRVAAIAACLFLAAGIGLLLQMHEPGDTSGPGTSGIAKTGPADEFDAGDRLAMNERSDIASTLGRGKKMSRQSGVEGLENRRWTDQKTLAGRGERKLESGGGGAGDLSLANAAKKPGVLSDLGIDSAPSTGNNTLVIETTGDVAMAEENLSALFISNGIALTREVDVADVAEVGVANTQGDPVGRAGGSRRMRKAQTELRGSKMADEPARFGSKEVPKVQTVTFSGRVPVAKAMLLASEIADKRQFQVTEGHGLFITAAEFQKARLANAELRKQISNTVDLADATRSVRAPQQFSYKTSRATRRETVADHSGATAATATAPGSEDGSRGEPSGGDKAIAATTKAAPQAPAKSDEPATGSAAPSPVTLAVEGQSITAGEASEPQQDNENNVAGETDRDEQAGGAAKARRGERRETEPQRVAMQAEAKETETSDHEPPVREEATATDDRPGDAVAEALKSKAAFVEQSPRETPAKPSDTGGEEPVSAAQEARTSDAGAPGDSDNKNNKNGHEGADRLADASGPATGWTPAKAEHESTPHDAEQLMERSFATDAIKPDATKAKDTDEVRQEESIEGRIRGRNRFSPGGRTTVPEVTLAKMAKKDVAPTGAEGPEEEKMFIVVRLVVRPGPSTGAVTFDDAMAAKKATRDAAMETAEDAEADRSEPAATEVAPADTNAPHATGEHQQGAPAHQRK